MMKNRQNNNKMKNSSYQYLRPESEHLQGIKMKIVRSKCQVQVFFYLRFIQQFNRLSIDNN
jgi:hypothetical protein